MRIITLFMLILLAVGILVNFIPTLSYFFGTVTHKKYYNSFSDGLSLEYCGKYSSLGVGYTYGFIINITKINGSYYLVQSKLYSLTGQIISSPYLLPSLPFFASSVREIYNYSAVLNINNSTFLSLIFPEGSIVKTSLLNFSIPNSITYLGPIEFLGCPGYHYFSTNDDMTCVYYILYGSQYVLVHFLAFQSKLATDLFISMFPNYSSNESSKIQFGICLSMNLGYGNGAPTQDLFSWFEYGFSHYAWPINVILLFSGGILAVFNYRKTH